MKSPGWAGIQGAVSSFTHTPVRVKGHVNMETETGRGFSKPQVTSPRGAGGPAPEAPRCLGALPCPRRASGSGPRGEQWCPGALGCYQGQVKGWTRVPAEVQAMASLNLLLGRGPTGPGETGLPFPLARGRQPRLSSSSEKPGL